METAQERELHGWQALWPLDTMAFSLDTTTTSSSGFLFGWDPQLSYFGLGAWGVGAGDLDTHEREFELVVPKCKPRSACLHSLHSCSRSPGACVSMAFLLTRLLRMSSCMLGMESPVSETSTAGATGLSTLQDATVMPRELDELLQVSESFISVNEDSHAILDCGALFPQRTLAMLPELMGLGRGEKCCGLQYLQRSEGGECCLFPM